ncbi:MAG: hypothetical protein J6X18_07325 [Bacteroidales bacterium]|nr:hypothetical protein [Bacteroidales bacterium]
MPTGLTHQIYYGTNMSLRSFALKCATHIGYGYRASDYGSRELPLDKPPVVEADKYHLEQMKEAEEKLEMWKDIKGSPRKARRLYENEIEKRRSENSSFKEKNGDIKERYIDMLEVVDSWHPKNDFAEVKNLMVEQLFKCIEYDCLSDDLIPYVSETPSIDEWIDSKIEFYQEEIEYHRTKYEEEVKYVNECNQWIADLYASLDEFEKQEQECE